MILHLNLEHVELEFHHIDPQTTHSHSKGPEEILPQDIIADEGMLDLVASLRHIRVNYVHFSSEEQYMYETLSWNLKILITKHFGSSCHKLFKENL